MKHTMKDAMSTYSRNTYPGQRMIFKESDVQSEMGKRIFSAQRLGPSGEAERSSLQEKGGEWGWSMQSVLRWGHQK